MTDVAAMAKVAMVLVSAFSKDKVTSKDLTAADEAVRGLTFDLFNEHVSSRVMTGIELADFETLINSIAKRLKIPDDIRLAILEGKLAATNQEVVRNFYFAKGESGSFTYNGRIVTVKPNKSTINLAYSLYHLDFKLSPQVIEHTKKKKWRRPLKHESTINLAYSMYHHDWRRPLKHTPQAPQETIPLIWYTTGREVWPQLGKGVSPLKKNTKLVDEL